MVASLSVGVARAWEIVGLPDTGAISSIRLIMRGFIAPSQPAKHAASPPPES